MRDWLNYGLKRQFTQLLGSGTGFPFPSASALGGGRGRRRGAGQRRRGSGCAGARRRRHGHFSLGGGTCLIRPHFFYSPFIVSRITAVCQLFATFEERLH